MTSTPPDQGGVARCGVPPRPLHRAHSNRVLGCSEAFDPVFKRPLSYPPKHPFSNMDSAENQAMRSEELLKYYRCQPTALCLPPHATVL